MLTKKTSLFFVCSVFWSLGILSVITGQKWDVAMGLFMTGFISTLYCILESPSLKNFFIFNYFASIELSFEITGFFAKKLSFKKLEDYFEKERRYYAKKTMETWINDTT